MQVLKKYRNFYLLKCWSFKDNQNVTVLFYKNTQIRAQIKSESFFINKGEFCDHLVIEQAMCGNIEIVFDDTGSPGIVLLDQSKKDGMVLIRKYENSKKTGFYLTQTYIRNFDSAPNNFVLKI
jgi:hypothetical protein